MNTVLFWFRRDLRLTDNRGLKAASETADRLFAVYIVDPAHRQWNHSCGDRLQFHLDCLRLLRKQVREEGGELIVRCGEQTEVFEKLLKQLKPEAVCWNRSYEPYEISRDRKVRNLLEKKGCEVRTFKDLVFFEKEEILTRQQTPYKVFTPYSRRWKGLQKQKVVATVTCFAKTDIKAGEIPTVKELGLKTGLTDTNWQPGRRAALKCWAEFRKEGLENYDKNRDLPAEKQGTSRLSPYLRAGVISVRELYHEARECLTGFSRARGVETFIDQLIWRDFYFQVLANFPRVVDSNFKEKYNAVEWETHPDWLEAWKSGNTGYPLIDAAMRQLNRTGWMHNRLRMIVAMFLTKNCLIHWKEGEQYFMNHLLDGDTAANNGGWQWSASTGTDAAPYFRIFNPVSQSEKYDPEGEFIRRYCPELSGLDAKKIHAPFTCSKESLGEAGIELGRNYPQPIFDHKIRRQHAIDVFKKIYD
ncbi:MAG: cryptochrome/photolyase family protein [bacterium]